MSDSKGHNPYNTYPNNQFDNSPPPYSANPAVPQLYPAYPASHPNSYPSAMQSNPYPQTQANPYPTPPTQQPSYPPTTQPNPYSFAQSAQHPMATKASAFFGPYLKYGNVDINAWLWYGMSLKEPCARQVLQLQISWRRFRAHHNHFNNTLHFNAFTQSAPHT